MNGRLASYFALTKPGVVILLQITGICSVMAHDLLEAGGLSVNTARTIAVVLLGVPHGWRCKFNQYVV